MTVYTRLGLVRERQTKAPDVNWFPAQSYPIIGVEKRGPKGHVSEERRRRGLGAMSNQFFTTLIRR
jgi:hypothetical protein